MRRLVALLALVASSALAAACTDAEVATPTATVSSTTEPATTAPPTSTAPSSTVASTTTTSAPPTTTTPPPDVLPLPDDAERLAEGLVEAEAAIRDTTTSDPAAWGRRQQALYRALSANPDWGDTVLAATGDSPHAAAIAANWAARQDLSALVRSTRLATELPAWRIVDPLPADELMGYYLEAEEATGVPWEILAAIHLVETRLGRIEGLSTAGALGPMQFLPSTWAGCCVGDPTVARDAIVGAGTYLVQRGALDDLDGAIFGYNNSDRYVRAVRAYASVLEADPRAFAGYHAWEVYFLSAEGLLVLRAGYEQAEPIPVADYLADHPDALVG